MLEVPVTTIRPGNHLSVDRAVFEVVSYEHVKPGKGGAFVRLRIKNVETGAVMEKTFGGDTRVSQVEVAEHAAQYLYQAGEKYVFMNLETYEQVEIPGDALKELKGYLKPDIEVSIIECEGRMLGVEMPITVELEVRETPPGIKGDTVARGTKPATLETGFVVQVPLFISNGDRIKLDTRTGEYIERA